MCSIALTQSSRLSKRGCVVPNKMRDKNKTKEQLTKELTELRQQIVELEQSKNERKKMIEGGSEEELRAIIDCAQDGIVLLDLTGKVTAINKGITETAGYTEKDIIGKRLTRLKMFPPKSIATMFTAFTHVISGQQPPPYEVEAYTKTGEKLVVEIHGSLLRKGGEKAGVVAVLRDVTERKQMEALLLREREIFVTILQNALYGAVLLDRDGKHVYVNPAFTAITGYTLEDIPTGKDWMHKAYPDKAYRQKVTALWKQDRGVGGTKRVISIVCKNGETKEIEFRSTVLDDGRSVVMLTDVTERERAEEVLQRHREHLEELVTERTAALQATNAQLQREITERKQIEKELRESEKKYRELINGMHDTAWVIDFEGKFIDVNDAAVEVLGYSRKELFAMGPHDIDFSLDKQKITDLIKGMRMDEMQLFETIHTTKDGKAIPVEINSSLVTYQGKHAILSIARDITERKQMEEVLRESEEKLRIMFDSIRDGIFVTDLEANIVDSNEAALRMSGYHHKEEITGRNAFDFIAVRDRDRAMNNMMKTFDERSTPAGEFTLMDKDGIEFIGIDERVKNFITNLIKEYNYQGHDLFIAIAQKIHNLNSPPSPHKTTSTKKT